MPSLPLTAPPPLDGGELVVRSPDDVLSLLPPEVRRSTTAPVRDALIAALTEILREYQRRSSRGAALGDILRATGTSLDGLAADHEVFKQPGEADESLRARMLEIDALVTPHDILLAVNTILAPFTTLRAKYFESELDAWFVDDGTVTSWGSFVYVEGQPQASPRYPDRYYADEAAENDGFEFESREVLGAWAFADALGRYFVLRIPQLEAVDDLGSYAFDATVDDDGMFAADGSDTAGAESDGSVTSFIYTDQVQSDELYAAIVSTVELLKGQGMRWQAYVDPLLS
jgi:hypothetical protein